MKVETAIGICIVSLGLLSMLLSGCASFEKGKPLPPLKMGKVTAHIVVWHPSVIDKKCGIKNVNACTVKRDTAKNRCWIYQADTAAGAKAGWHEASHCLDKEPNEVKARTFDWPGTIKPKEYQK